MRKTVEFEINGKTFEAYELTVKQLRRFIGGDEVVGADGKKSEIRINPLNEPEHFTNLKNFDAYTPSELQPMVRAVEKANSFFLNQLNQTEQGKQVRKQLGTILIASFAN